MKSNHAVNLRCALWAALLIAAVPVQAQEAQPRVQVEQFLVTGNTLLPQTKLDAALAPFKGERSMAELNRAAQAVQELYRQAGYGAVIAYVPEQMAGPAGTTTIAVLEGQVARVVVSGNQRFSELNIRRSLPLLAEGRTPQVVGLDSQIKLANENPAKQVAVSLEAGQAPGEVYANVLVTEQPVQRWIVSVDNTGNASTGRLRANLAYQHAALWDLDHVLGLQFQFAPEKPRAVAVLSASYRVPLYAQGMSFDAFLAHSNVDGGSTGTAAGPLQFSGQGDIAALRLTKYLQRQGEVEQRLAVGFDQRAYKNECSIGGLPSGACGNAGESVTVHPLSLEYSVQRESDNPVNLTLAFMHNLALGGRFGGPENFDAVRPGASRNYNIGRVNFSGSTQVAPQWQVQARLSAQYSRNALVPGEQYGVGGASSVRGFEEREIVGDRGLYGSVELHAPQFTETANSALAGLRVLAFADAGKVHNLLGTPCLVNSSSCDLASFGVGGRLGVGRLQVRLDVAHTVKAAARTGRNDTAAHFVASYSFQ